MVRFRTTGRAALALAGFCATAQAIPAHAQNVPEAPALFAPVPPAQGSAMDVYDRTVFAETRKLKDTARWALARSDADARPEALLADFSCAIGHALTDKSNPALFRLVSALRDAVKAQVKIQKDIVRRPRPFVGNDAPICVARKEDAAADYAYPSGHATTGWSAALLLSSLFPAHTGQILARGREYGESRVVCGVHWASDVWAGFVTGSVVFAQFVSDPAHADLLDAAWREIAAQQRMSGGLDQKRCTAEDQGRMVAPLTGNP
ncbi:acid phosphatase [Gluconacetobacter asukensis]|uniref:Acid phosphatase n=1 Tax=Gluconacetobacter asukensis TaxID=1017181 RepID=A0A7W4P184_9PROT|nr:phosphatase PAP2 family protein [Gluconacetobacter asukensis]MBB2173876.1 phosphatase PAP2 family protein [Gluconacetobacter asukensis]